MNNIIDCCCSVVSMTTGSLQIPRCHWRLHGDVSAVVQTRLELFRPLSWDSSVSTSAIRASRDEKSMGVLSLQLTDRKFSGTRMFDKENILVPCQTSLSNILVTENFPSVSCKERNPIDFSPLEAQIVLNADVPTDESHNRTKQRKPRLNYCWYIAMKPPVRSWNLEWPSCHGYHAAAAVYYVVCI